MTETTSDLKLTALNGAHKALGAKMVSFAGYEMPVYYKGIVAEHKAVRESVGMFDVSHMGEVFVTGPKALDYVQKITINDASKLADGKAQYSAMCRLDGGIVDDLLVYQLAEDRYMLVINAANIDKDFGWMQENSMEGANLSNVSDEYTLLAIQGPHSLDLLSKLTDVNLNNIEFYHFIEGTLAGVQMIISRTGYTGELGFELYLSSDEEESKRVWEAVMEAGQEFDIQPVGLGARDTLRMEMGYCLYGNDITEETNPIEAGLSWITKLDKGSFNGSEAIARVEEEKPKRKLIAFKLEEKGIPRQGYKIMAEGEEIGEVTSGTMSPSLGIGIGMGYVASGYSKKGTTINIVVREKEIPALVHRPPSIKKP
ncbi:MAG: glycine cleavage system aminomethyltransferase GcvT [Chlorobi bacterium]|nr:glycine cleavage system aminomethyltransferase GcvT [Chlorobiota bacterium]